MARKPARIHLHYVHVEGDLYAVEVRQGATARTIGRVAGGKGGRWVGLVIAGRQWGPWVATRREATAPLLAAQRLVSAGERGTLLEVIEPGDVVDYRGSIAPLHGRYVIAAERGYDGRFVLLHELTGDVALRQVGRESLVLTGYHFKMCECGHPANVHTAELYAPYYDSSCTSYGCGCSRTAAELAGLAVAV